MGLKYCSTPTALLQGTQSVRVMFMWSQRVKSVCGKTCFSLAGAIPLQQGSGVSLRASDRTEGKTSAFGKEISKAVCMIILASRSGNADQSPATSLPCKCKLIQSWWSLGPGHLSHQSLDASVGHVCQQAAVTQWWILAVSNWDYI